jgi:hypothetical protein
MSIGSINKPNVAWQQALPTPRPVDTHAGTKLIYPSAPTNFSQNQPKLDRTIQQLKAGASNASQHLEANSLKPEVSIKSDDNFAQKNGIPDRGSRQRSQAIGHKQAASKSISMEITNMKLDATPKNVVGTFLRAKSSGITHITNLLINEFKMPAEQFLSVAINTFRESLSAAGPKPSLDDLDNVLTTTFKTMMTELGKIPFSDNFREVVASIERDIDASVQKNCAQLTDQYAKQEPPMSARQMKEGLNNISLTAPELKKGIVKALLLRVFTPHLAEMVRNTNTDRKAEFKAFDKFFDENPATKNAVLNMMKMQALLLSNIKGASGDKQNALGETFPTLLKTFKASSLPDLQKLVSNK